ncbi:alpha/beta-hydrolase [Lentithecium fluviatile CBS 122367]|uniref:1-alkyl-2-acetylglycerophosphocholine esterase n=1 Tax=Lentithecium fluviatile CBS 122367 TaxID=1168545 RepID=A0A6G1IYM2_9PLEO|nr:alpha/beta-hydrolase [Lentithecium fluviatile CBS 122367]
MRPGPTKLTALHHLLLQPALSQPPIPLPQGTGRYSISLTNQEWTDPTRPDPFNQSHPRRIMTSRFDPVPPSQCHSKQVPYMPPTTAAVEDEILAAYGYPKGLWARFVQEEKWPLALFSPGLNTTRFFSNHLAQEIASHGFTVISMDHPYDTDVVEFPNGDVVFGGRVEWPANGSTASVEHALEVRAKDASFVLDRLGIGRSEEQRAVMFGHSFGGAAAATALLNDGRFRAGINIDGTMFGPVLNYSLGTLSRPQAFMLFGSDGHSSFTDPSWSQFWAALNGSANVDYKKEFSITKSVHGSYWDLNILVDIAGIREELSEMAKLIIGPVPGKRVWEVMGRYAPAFFRFALRLEEEDRVLRGEDGDFPDVVLLRG